MRKAEAAKGCACMCLAFFDALIWCTYDLLVSSLTSLLHNKMFICAGELVGFKVYLKSSLICLRFFLTFTFGSFMFDVIP